MDKIIGLKELRENLPAYAEKIERGASFTVVKKSKPIFRICPFDEDDNRWEEVVDFTKMKKGGVAIDDLIEQKIYLIRDQKVMLDKDLATHKDILKKIEEMEKRYDKQFRIVFQIMRGLTDPTNEKGRN